MTDTNNVNFCTECGGALSEGSQFCEHCGAQLDIQPAGTTMLPQADGSAAPMMVRWQVAAGVVLLAVLVIAIGAWMALGRQGPQQAASETNPPSQPKAVAAVPSESPTADEVVTTDTSTHGLNPVDVVYKTFMDEAIRSRGGKLRVGSPHVTEDRIDNTLTVDGNTLPYVFVEIANDGQTAEVLVGPPDAGADRSYTLSKTSDGWVITGFKDGEF